MRKVYEINDYTFYEYSPNLLKPFYVNLESLSFRRRIRFLLALFSGYKVYYLKKDEKFIGYCVVQNGKDKRYKFASEKDIIVGPYFIKETYRGQKLSIVMLDTILNKVVNNYRIAYDYIHKDNIASIKASESIGFEFMSDAEVSKYMRAISLCEKGQGDYFVFKYIPRF